MDDSLALVFASANIAQAILAACMLSFRAQKAAAYLPMALFFALNTITDAETIFRFIAPEFETLIATISVPTLLALCPLFWMYLEGITEETRWRFQRNHIMHFIPAGMGLFAAILLAFLPQATRTSILSHEGGEFIQTHLSVFTVLYVLFLIFIWFCQMAYYFVKGWRRLRRYRKRLKDVFATTENRELTWLVLVFGTVGCFWLIHFFMMVFAIYTQTLIDNPASEELLALLLTFCLAVWSLRQAPGFEQVYHAREEEVRHQLILEIEKPEPGEIQPEKLEKYKRSALGEEQSLRIANKLETAMTSEQLFLNPNLSLLTLARRIGVSTNILSQTLNETIGFNFFDYINKHRIEAAIPLVLQKKETILSIALAVGFNSRSAFYKAFKKETGQTPRNFLRLNSTL